MTGFLQAQKLFLELTHAFDLEWCSLRDRDSWKSRRQRRESRRVHIPYLDSKDSMCSEPLVSESLGQEIHVIFDGAVISFEKAGKDLGEF